MLSSNLKVLEHKPMTEIDDQTLILADMAQKALRQVEGSVRELLGERMQEDQAKSLARTLATGTWTHDYPITVQEARKLGLHVSCDMPLEVYQLMQMYPPSGRGHPSVEYVPLPYGPRDSQPRRSTPAGQERGD